MNRIHVMRTGAVGLACAAAGVGAGVLDSASGASSPASPKAAHKAAAGAGRQGGLRALRRAVHVEAVVPVAGGKFATATLDRGMLAAVSGSTLTIREGTKKASYKSVTIAVPPGAKVKLDRQPATLSGLVVGDRVLVFHGPKRTRVAAFDARAKRRGPATH